jgi:hypothetical protein
MDKPQIPYIPSSLKDPLDVEVAHIVNSIQHGFLIERMDPPSRAAPTPGTELKAQYAFSNALGRKIINCKLVIVHRTGTKSAGGVEAPTKKVMCRVGGGESFAFVCCPGDSMPNSRHPFFPSLLCLLQGGRILKYTS